jgi:Fur family transcriptional regulator, ferric uptake regulator
VLAWQALVVGSVVEGGIVVFGHLDLLLELKLPPPCPYTIANAFAFARTPVLMERQTRQQHAVMQAIRDSGRSLSPQDVWLLSQRVVPRINLSTVYRQLKTLLDQGHVVRVQLPGQAPRFEAAHLAPPASARGRRVIPLREGGADRSPAHALSHHHHFHCLSCEQVFPLHACPGGMEKLVPRGYEVQRHDLTLHGRCPRCVSGAAA